MNRKGFTLVELLAVVLIIGTLTAVALPQYKKVVEKAKVTEAAAMLRSIYDSSERLAGNLGYKTYSSLPSDKQYFTKFDIFDKDNLPKGCMISGNTLFYTGCTSSSTSSCKFVYKINTNYVVAKKLKTPYANSLIGFKKADSTIYCKSSDANACDVFGLDTDSNLSF